MVTSIWTICRGRSSSWMIFSIAAIASGGALHDDRVGALVDGDAGMTELRRLAQKCCVRRRRLIGGRGKRGRRSWSEAEDRGQRIRDPRNRNGAALELLGRRSDIGEPQRNHFDLEILELVIGLLREFGSLELQARAFFRRQAVRAA